MAMPPFLRVCVNCQNFEIVVTKSASCGAAVGAFVTRRIAEYWTTLGTAENAASNIIIRRLHVRSGERSHLCRSVRTVTLTRQEFYECIRPV